MPLVNGSTARKEKMIPLRLTENDYNEIKKNAEKHAGGNISEWLRRRGKEPMEDQVIEREKDHTST
jgi:hypothetical protein